MTRFLDKNELLDKAHSHGPGHVASNYVLRKTPWLFRETLNDYDTLKKHVSDRLGIDDSGIYIVGSACLGYSLSPDHFGQPFGDDSDIDILIVSDAWFDEVWLEVLDWARGQPTPNTKTAQLIHTSLRRDLFWGRLWPDRLTGIARRAFQWFDTFQSLSVFPEFSTWKASGRLYRTLAHAEVQQAWVVSEIVTKYWTESDKAKR